MITGDAELAAGADGLVLPGVGAFPKAMARIRELGLDRLIADRLAAGTPVLGICLGFQLVFERSSELEGAEGLGLVAGEVDGLRAPGLKVPHIGWEPVRWERECELTAGIGDATPFYFVHSFAPRPADPGGRPRHGRARRAVRLRDRPAAALRGPVSPREVERRRTAPAAELRRDLRARRRFPTSVRPA